MILTEVNINFVSISSYLDKISFLYSFDNLKYKNRRSTISLKEKSDVCTKTFFVISLKCKLFKLVSDELVM